MRLRARLIPILLLVAMVPVGLAACAGTDHGDDHMDGGWAADGMMADGTMMDADVMFAQMMIPHHEQAIEMADIALDPAREASPAVTVLAQQIKAAQDPEIRQMRAWLDAEGVPTMAAGDAMAEHGGHGGMQGMLSVEQLDALRAATGPAFDRLFLEGMIEHHEGAVAMAEDLQADGDDPGLRTLAGEIITAQEAEIAEMRRLLAG